ncbi:MAG: DNA repair protein RecO [Devosia sp.]|uniref:DNA repair protein RecO n=1 Tax=unclassified Devosia TaxID=196773 RepID=UPI0019F8E781|nr:MULTISPECIES: DNA repair protein RecO [unclassified Devosia]MBF0679718.1 DNA repair protein RecO [Devosia sp.]WEJ32113.1 DNA repair protein RecO [Devosia sp. SD17-2]
MEWTGEALLIGVRRHGETSVIAEAMVAGRGRYLGLVRGGRSPRLAATLQAGNTVQLTWRARTEDQLGQFSIELLQARAAELIADPTRLYLSQLVCEHLRLLPERDPHDRLLGMALSLIDHAPDGVALARFELAVLDELGFGLDLESCAATGVTTDLTHVSPRSGRAVSRAAAEPYRDKLLKLPSFLVARGNASPGDIEDAFRLSGFFLERHVWGPRRVDVPAVRDMLLNRLMAKAE